MTNQHHWRRWLFGLNAIVATFAVLLSLTLALTGYYVDTVNPDKATLLGNTAAGVDTPFERFFDWITYFTIWSNIVVAIVLIALTVRPDLFAARSRSGFIWRTLRLDSLLMIIVTGVVYNLLLAGGEKSGWDFVNNFGLHILTPILTTLVWLIAGPRRLINARIVAAAMVLPVVWLVFALVRGQVIGAYPYPFLDVATNGWSSVLGFVVAIILVAIILAFILMGIDRLLGRSAKNAESTA